MSSSRVAAAIITALTAGLSVTAPSAQAATVSIAAPPPDLPRHAPAAATDVQPRLHEPSRATWPFPARFPQTSGAGRLAGGASLWSDFLFDDRGAALPPGLAPSALQLSSILAPTQGTYVYPAGAARNNGADIFRTGVGLTRSDTYWRVDWLTLADPKVPIAAWTFDTDGDASTGYAQWPAAAGVRSAGIDRALVISSRGAWLVDPRSGARTNVTSVGGALTVDRGTQAFIVRIPRRALPVSGRWRVRLASGLADAAGTAFAPAHVIAGGLTPGGMPRVYNVTYRRVDQEPPVYRDGFTSGLIAAYEVLLAGIPGVGPQLGLDGTGRFVTGNNWMEDNQADTLAGGDVSKFSRVVDWSRLAARTTTAEPVPTGYSVRWYPSRFKRDGGLVTGEVGTGGGLVSGIPTLLSRAQPYAVYVPTDYSPRSPAPLTWVLHSLEANYNQYGALDPKLLQQLCEQRESICATTAGYGPAGSYEGEAETDYWQVWRALADAYALDPERTVVSGYSMGGAGTNVLGIAHPDLYAGGMVLDGAFGGLDWANLKWVPYVIDNTVADELSFPTSALEEGDAFDALGQRYDVFLHVGADHLVYATQDRFDNAVAALGRPVRTTAPGDFSYTWDPRKDNAAQGIGVTGVYWLDGLRARVSTANAKVKAVSLALPERAITAVRSGTMPVTGPIPGIHRSLKWQRGSPPAAQSRVSLGLANVGAVSVDTRRARLPQGTVEVVTDGPVTLRLTALRRGTKVVVAGRRVATAGRARTATVVVPQGTTSIALVAPR